MESVLYPRLDVERCAGLDPNFSQQADAKSHKRKSMPFIRFVLTVVVLTVPGRAMAALVDLSFAPVTQTAVIDDIVEIDVIASSNDATNMEFGVVSAILDWDPDVLELVGISSANAGYAWLFEDLTDLGEGNSVYSALPQFALPAIAPPPPGLIVTTIQFRALAETAGTEVSYKASMGSYVTRVYRFDEPNQSITGDISSTASVQILCGPPGSGDVNGDDEIDLDDVTTAVQVLLGVDSDPQHVDAVDANCDGEINGRDIQPLVNLLL